MKTINLISVISLVFLTTVILFTPVQSSQRRLRRQLFPSSSSSSAGTVAGTGTGGIAGAGAGAGAGASPFSQWFGQMPSPTSFQLPMNMFPNPDQVRQRAQDYISVVSKQIQDQAIQQMNKLQSLLPLSPKNCTPTETKTETVDVNGRKFNQTTTSCISSGPGSVATAVSSSSVPITEQN